MGFKLERYRSCNQEHAHWTKICSQCGESDITNWRRDLISASLFGFFTVFLAAIFIEWLADYWYFVWVVAAFGFWRLFRWLKKQDANIIMTKLKAALIFATIASGALRTKSVATRYAQYSCLVHFVFFDLSSVFLTQSFYDWLWLLAGLFYWINRYLLRFSDTSIFCLGTLCVWRIRPVGWYGRRTQQRFIISSVL